MPRRTKQESEATAARITETARTLFAQHGYSGVGLEAVAAEVAVTRGAVYHHFGSKAGLFTAVLAAAHRDVGDRVGAAVAAEQDDWSQMEAGCLEFLRAALDEANRRIMLIDAPAVLGWQQWRRFDEAHSGRLLAEGLDHLARAGLIRAGIASAAAPMLSGAMNEAALWVAHTDEDGALAQAEEALRVLLRGLRVR